MAHSKCCAYIVSSSVNGLYRSASGNTTPAKNIGEYGYTMLNHHIVPVSSTSFTLRVLRDTETEILKCIWVNAFQEKIW